MTKSFMIGLKYAGIGLISFAITAFFLVRVMDETISAGFGAGIWVAMILLSSKEAYEQGQKGK